MADTELRLLSLCTGYGGLELGLRLAGENVRTVAYVEREGFACANLVAKIEAGLLDEVPIWTDIRTFDGTLFCGKVDITTAGYPCQPFSCAGKRKGTDDPRHLFPYIAKIVEAVRPTWCFFENVPGHLTMGFPEVYCRLRDLGYAVEAGLFSAEEVGASHKRERLFIVAHNGNGDTREGGVCTSGSGIVIKKGGEADSARTSCGQGGNRRGKRGQLADSNRSRNSQSGFQQSDILAESSELADAESGCTWKQTEQEGWQNIIRGSETRWPARPGESQYEWEEPRVTRETQSRLGRTTDGTSIELDKSSMRVDRLRLLGNGVVAQTAAKAWMILKEQMKKQ